MILGELKENGLRCFSIFCVSQANKNNMRPTKGVAATASQNKFLYNIQRKCQAEGPKRADKQEKSAGWNGRSTPRKRSPNVTQTCVCSAGALATTKGAAKGLPPSIRRWQVERVSRRQGAARRLTCVNNTHTTRCTRQRQLCKWLRPYIITLPGETSTGGGDWVEAGWNGRWVSGWRRPWLRLQAHWLHSKRRMRRKGRSSASA